MISHLNLHPQYITNESGEKTAVILPLAEFEELLEDLADLAVLAERQSEQTLPHQELIAEFERDGLL